LFRFLFCCIFLRWNNFFLFLLKFHIFRDFMGDKKNACFWHIKNGLRAKKWVFSESLFCSTFSRRDETLCLYHNLISSTFQRFHGGTRKTPVVGPQKNGLRSTKMSFFRFFSAAHLLVETKLFCSTKISYLQRFRDFMGGARKRNNNNHKKRTNNAGNQSTLQGSGISLG